MSNFQNTMNPLGRLSPPGNYDHDVQVSLQKIYGPIGIVDKTIQLFTGWSPLQWAIDELGGNWGQLFTLRDTWNSVSWAVSDIKENISLGQKDLAADWNGNAAQAFQTYMDSWAEALGQEQHVAVIVRDKMDNLGVLMQDLVNTVSAILNEVLSLIATGFASMEIPGYGEFKAAKNAWEAYKLFNQAKKVVTLYVNTVKLVAVVFQNLADLANLHPDTNPDSVYVNVPDAYIAPPV